MTATILPFREPRQSSHFTKVERGSIKAAAMSISLRWDARFHQTDPELEIATIGSYAGGDDRAQDSFGILKIAADRVELRDYTTPGITHIYTTVAAALSAMRALAAGSLRLYFPGRELNLRSSGTLISSATSES